MALSSTSAVLASRTATCGARRAMRKRAKNAAAIEEAEEAGWWRRGEGERAEREVGGEETKDPCFPGGGRVVVVGGEEAKGDAVKAEKEEESGRAMGKGDA